MHVRSTVSLGLASVLTTLVVSSAAAVYDYEVVVAAPSNYVKVAEFEIGNFKHTFTNTGDQTDTYRMVITEAEYFTGDDITIGWTMCTTTACVVPGIADEITLAPGESDTVTVKISTFSTLGGGTCRLRIESVGSGVANEYDYGGIILGTELILIDDDGGTDDDDDVIAALESGLTSYAVFDTSIQSLVDSGIEMSDAACLIYHSGYSSSGTLTAGDADYLAAYLDDAGSLLVSGDDLFDEIDGSSFATTYLAAGLGGSAAGQTIVNGVPASPLGSTGSYPLSPVSPDVLTGTAAYEYGNETTAGVLHDGGSYKTLSLGFALAGLGASDILAVVEEACTWLRDALATPVVSGPALIQTSAYPNPFRRSARIRLTASETIGDDVRVTLYDVSGRRISVLHDGPIGVGETELAVDGAGLPNGVYVYRVESGQAVTTGAVTLVR